MNFGERRRILLGLVGAGLAACAPQPARQPAAAREPKDSLGPAHGALEELEKRTGGRLGVFALDTGNGRSVGHREHERFRMCSTFKWVLAAQALAQCDAGDWLLDEQMPFGEVDLLEYAPVVRAHLAERQMTIEQLCEAMVTFSDNSAANLVLHRLGGPLAFTEVVRRWGDAVTRLDRNEPTLNAHDSPQDERDTTSPRAMVHLCQRVLCGDVLLQPSRERLLGWMRSSETGLARLRAGLPTDWTVGDKTGTGMHGGVNDVAIAMPPGRKPILIASYMSDSAAPLEQLNAAHAEVGRIVARALG